MNDLKHKISGVLLREKLIDTDDISSRRFSVRTQDRPLPFEQIWGTYRIRLNIAENDNTPLKPQLIRFMNDLEKHRDQKHLKLVHVKSKRDFFVFMDPEYTKVVCYLLMN